MINQHPEKHYKLGLFQTIQGYMNALSSLNKKK